VWQSVTYPVVFSLLLFSSQSYAATTASPIDKYDPIPLEGEIYTNIQLFKSSVKSY